MLNDFRIRTFELCERILLDYFFQCIVMGPFKVPFTCDLQIVDLYLSNY